MKSHVEIEHTTKEPDSFKCKECDFVSNTQVGIEEHMKTKQRTVPNCVNCKNVNEENTILKVKLESLNDVQKNYEVARKMYLEKEKEMEKSDKAQKKEMEKEGLDNIKLEDAVRRLTMEN